jgi:hypothetical protein
MIQNKINALLNVCLTPLPLPPPPPPPPSFPPFSLFHPHNHARLQHIISRHLNSTPPRSMQHLVQHQSTPLGTSSSRSRVQQDLADMVVDHPVGQGMIFLERPVPVPQHLHSGSPFLSRVCSLTHLLPVSGLPSDLRRRRVPLGPSTGRVGSQATTVAQFCLADLLRVAERTYGHIAPRLHPGYV